MAAIRPDIDLQPTVNAKTTKALQTGCVHIAEQMAQSSRSVTIHQMMVMMDRHLCTEICASATSVLVDAQQEHHFAAIWGDEHVSSSDGWFFPAGGRGEACLEYNAKYGKRPGASIYGFLSNRFASFFPE